MLPRVAIAGDLISFLVHVTWVTSPILNWREEEGQMYGKLQVRLCDIAAPLVLILSSSMRKANLSGYTLEFWNIFVIQYIQLFTVDLRVAQMISFTSNGDFYLWINLTYLYVCKNKTPKRLNKTFPNIVFQLT